MITIAFDTNFLIYCAKQKIDFVSEIERLCSSSYQLIVPQQVIAELKKIASSSKGREGASAGLVLQLLESLISQKKIVVKRIKSGDADGALLQMDKKDFLIASLDRELGKKLKNAKLLSIKQFKYIYFA